MNITKKITAVLCAILLFQSVFAAEKSQTPVDEDLEYLKTCLTQCWVGYDEAVKKGFNLDKCIRRIKRDYNLSKSSHKRKKNQDKKHAIYNDVDNWAMTYAIRQNLIEDLKNVSKDRHFSVYGDDNGGPLFYHNWEYYSSVYFEKKGDEYFVISSGEDKIVPGMKYTGTAGVLFPWIKGNQLLYRFGIKNDYYQKTAKIELDKKEYEVPVTYTEEISKSKNHIGFETTEKTIYVSLSDCMLIADTEEKTKKVREHFDSVIKQICENNQKENLILDLRNNGGGYALYPREILKSYYYGNDEIKANNFYNYYDIFDFGTITLDSLEIAKKGYEDMKINFFDDEKRIQKALEHLNEQKSKPTRMYLGLADPVLSYLPQIKTSSYKGKIYILINSGTSSAAETGTALSYFEDKDKVILIGESSNGCIDFGGLYHYILPNSKVKISLCFEDGRKRAGLAHNEHWHGDTYGFYPDYYATSENMIDSIVYLTKDEELRTVLAGIEKGLK